jgi:type III secretion system FlhB-like substrate exporter
MPTYSLTSPTTGQSYDVDFSGAPSEADMEQAVAFYDQKFDELGGQHPRLLNQSTAGTAGMTAFRSLGDAAMNAIGGLAKLADVGGAQSFQAITGLPISTGLQDLAKQTDQIKEEARRHNIPRVENRPLARALFDGAKVGDPIPVHLYNAVAELLAYLYRIKNRRRS